MTIEGRLYAIYQRYAPHLNTPQHVGSLLQKYAGYEHELLELLVEKYGPEPLDTEFSRHQHQPPPPSHPHFNHQPNPSHSLHNRQDETEEHMWEVAEQEDLIQQLLSERAQLRSSLDVQHTNNRREFTDAVALSTKSKLDLSRVQARIPVGMHPRAEADDVCDGLKEVTNRLAGLIALRRALEETVSLHLQLYPTSKMRSVLVKENPGYCHRLENL